MNHSSSNRVPSGGSATVNGVMYQMLWSLLRSSSARVAIPESISKPTNFLTEATLILEPIGGGGDLVAISGNRRIVEQLKAKSGGGSWSLRDVFESVIPDLYIACEGKSDDVEYRFVTEGKMGDWKNVYKFFRSLRDRHVDKDAAPTLDDSTEIRFRKGKEDGSGAEPPFWDRGKYTEKLLVEKLVSIVRKRKKVASTESQEETTKKLLQLLGRFEFVGEKLLHDIQSQIDVHLLAVVDRKEDIPQIRDSLAFALARRATGGNAIIDSNSFFQEQGLSALPLTNWGAVKEAVQVQSSRALKLLQYEPSLDVRIPRAKQSISEWNSHTPILLVTGESGCGKSWHCFSICELEQSSQRLSVVVPAAADVDSTLTRASDVLWQDALGHDDSLSFLQIARRIQQVIPNLAFPWLTLVIEGHFDESQYKRLLEIDWETWGVRVVLPASKNLSSRLVRESRRRCSATEVSDFTEAELRRYLQNTVGSQHGQMPEFFRNPLRKPLLAGLFSEVVDQSSEDWAPSTEYQVFDRYWQKVADPIDISCLIGLAESRLDNASDTWTLQDVTQICGDPNAAQRLERLGWLRRTEIGVKPRYQFGHFRFLNWACAIALYQRLLEQEVTWERVAELLGDHLWRQNGANAHQLSFMPMDFLWLCCQNPKYHGDVANLVDSLSGENYNQLEGLFEELLPTLGATILVPLCDLLKRHISDWHRARLITVAIKSVGGQESQAVAEDLLVNQEPLLTVEAAKILHRASSKEVFESLWNLHVSCQTNPSEYSRPQEKADAFRFYDLTFGALRRCCIENPEWLSAKLKSVATEIPCISDLVYLIANLPQEQANAIWSEHKEKLFRLVGKNKQRSLAYCIDRVSDIAELDWLVRTIQERVDSAGPAALSALARLAPTVALEQLDQLDSRDFDFTKSWFNEHLLLNDCEATQKKLREMMLASPERTWGIAGFYGQHWVLVDEPTVELLLDALRDELTLELSAPPDTRGGKHLYLSLRMLLQATTVMHFSLLSRYAGSQLESLLADYVVRVGPRSSLGNDGLSRNEAIELLQRVGGDGYATAVECLLRADNRYGRYDGLKQAGKLRSPKIEACLTAICEQEETWDGHFVEQCEAAVALAEANVWQPVLELIRKIGLKVLRDVTSLARSEVRPDSSELQRILNELPVDLKNTSPGDILALGFGGEKEAQVVARIASECVPDSENALACVIALDCLNDHLESNVPFLAGQSRIKNRSFAATNALISNATDAAFEVLAKLDNHEELGAVTVNLLRRSIDSGLPQRIQKSVIERIENGRTWELINQLHFLVNRIANKELLQETLSDSRIQDYLWSQAYADEGVVWNTGMKARAIRCLAICDKPAASDACRVAIRNPDGRDLDYYPSLLVELDGVSGAMLLLELLRTIESEQLRVAVGRALSKQSLAELFQCDINSIVSEDCAVASFLSQWQAPNTELEDQLRIWLGSHDEALSRSSAKALLAMRRQKEAMKACYALVNETEQPRKWLWIDSILSLADIGDWHNKWPLHGPSIWDALSHSQSKYLSEKLKKLREKEFK